MTYAYAQEATNKVAVNMNAFDAIMSASIVVQLTLLTLVILSLLSWGVVFKKKKQFSAVASSDEEFLKVFWEARSWDEVNQQVNRFEDSPQAQLFKAGFTELQRIAERSKESDGKTSIKLSGIDNIARTLRKASDTQLSYLESKLTILATTGSTSPFIGLFGTVWGIMGAFQKIGATGAAHLAVVAPGISEALVATAIGLVVAIPAVISYNHYISKIKKVEVDLNSFATDFTNIAKRNFFKGE